MTLKAIRRLERKMTKKEQWQKIDVSLCGCHNTGVHTEEGDLPQKVNVLHGGFTKVFHRKG